MNNNMPNNFNNGLGNSNPEPNNVNNPMVDKANEQLIGGQSTVGNGPSVMQGMPNVQNERGVMQGIAGVSNGPTVMQGQPSSTTPNQNMGMPGQFNSGINSQTMQVETPKKETPGVVSIPGFDALETANPVVNPTLGNTPFPNPQAPREIPNVAPTQPINNEIKIPNMLNDQNVVNNQINEPVNSIGTEQKQEPQILGTVPKLDQNPVTTNPNLNNVNANTLNNGINSQVGLEQKQEPQIIGTAPKLEQNSALTTPSNNIRKSNIVGNINNSSANVNQGITTPNNTINKEVNSSIGIKPTSIGGGISQVGQTEMNSNVQMGYQEPPKKKFPLSVREMVLIGIALIGIVVVIIMYT